MHYNQQYAHRTDRCGSWGNKAAWHSRFQNYFRPVPVNIKETEDAFELFLFAPSLIKENISITTKDDILVVSYSAKEEENKENYTRKEYHYDSFERSFFLNNKVDTERIQATYKDGILKVILPKNPASNKPKQEVPIS